MFKKKVFTYLLLTRVGRIVLLISLVCIVLGYFFLCSSLFVIKEIEVFNSQLIDAKSLSQCKGKNIFLVPIDSLIGKIDEIPEVKSVVIKKELPSKLIVEIQEYTPCALLKGNMKLAVSEEGVVFPSHELVTEPYPIVIYEKEDSPVGEKWSCLEEAMKIYHAIEDMVPIGVIKVKKNDEIFLYSQNNKTEIRMNSGEYKEELNRLKILMDELPSKNVEYIDLRFGRDIVVKQ